jgi:hypothetical protein
VSDPDVQLISYSFRGGTYKTAIIRAGFLGYERIVPPAGEEHAFTRACWRHEIQVSVSPTGRSVQVHIDGKKAAVGGSNPPEREKQQP